MCSNSKEAKDSKDLNNCKICGKTLKNLVCKRYGAQACVACATFFHRSVDRIQEYVCRNFNLCLAMPSIPGAKCRKCRYFKCLELGMTHGRKAVTETPESKIIKCGEYYVLAKKLNNLFIIIQNNPQFLINYLEREDRTLIDKAFELLPNSQITNYLLPWAELLMNNQVPLNKSYFLFYSIVCKIQIPNLNFENQFRLIQFQKMVAQKELTPENYGSEEIREGFDKLTNFFVSEYSLYFGKTN